MHSQFVSRHDYQFIVMKQSFRINHESNRLNEFSLGSFDGLNYTRFRLFPKHISSDIARFQLHGDISISQGNWSGIIQPVVEKSVKGDSEFGTGFQRYDLNGRFINSFVRYDDSQMTIQLGRGPIRWGQSWSHSIIQSGIIPQYDHAYARAKIWVFSWDVLYGRLNTEFSNSNRISRHISGHKLSGLFINERLLFEFGEQIIYTGENRGFELMYINPGVPYVFAAYENEDLNVDGYNNDNGMIFVDFRWIQNPGLSFYGEFILDDYQLDDTDVQNMLGYKLGLDGAINLLNRQITFETEYTQIDSWTYIHHGQFTTLQNRGHAIGYPYGSDVRSFRIQADYWVHEKWILDVEYTWMEKGSYTLQMPWGNTNSKNDPFPSEPTSILNLFESSISYWMKHGIIEAGWSNIPFPHEIAYEGRTELKGSFFLKLQLVYELKHEF